MNLTLKNHQNTAGYFHPVMVKSIYVQDELLLWWHLPSLSSSISSIPLRVTNISEETVPNRDESGLHIRRFVNQFYLHAHALRSKYRPPAVQTRTMIERSVTSSWLKLTSSYVRLGSSTYLAAVPAHYHTVKTKTCFRNVVLLLLMQTPSLPR